jgi:hypothetical protein
MIEIPKDTFRQMADRIESVSDDIKPLLSGLGPEIQGAVLANLTALWIAGFHPELRDRMYEQQIDVTRKLVPSCEHEIFGDAGFPKDGLT